MSSFGGQWRIIRHYLSLTNLNCEVEKLVQKLKPATPEQWEEILRRFEKVVTTRFAQEATDFDKTKPALKKEVATTTPSIVETKAGAQVEKKNTEKAQEKPSQGGFSLGADVKEITIERLWQGLKLKKDLALGNISEQSWKSNKPTVSKEFETKTKLMPKINIRSRFETSIHSRTAYVISALVTAETVEAMQRRTVNFMDHIRQYPEARDYAIKEGAVRALLRVQHRLRNDERAPDTKEVGGIVNEALALLGYVGPPRGPGPNVLSIDGGGIRGIIAIEILRHLERLTGRRVDHLFDYIVGVSTGAIIAAVIGSGVGTLETANHMYHTLSKKMFGNTSIIGGTSRLVWSHSYYDTEAWEQLLRENLLDTTLTQCNRRNTPKMALVSCVVNAGSRLSPFLFRSYECGFRVRSVFPGTSKALVWHAVRASAAAPTYFNEFRLDGLLHQDGGIMVNNPTGVGLHEAKLLYGADAVRNGTVISVGTGKPLNKHTDYQLMAKGTEAQSTSWKDKFNKILDSATDTEGVHLVLSDLLPTHSYFRFNPPLMEECAMDEIDANKLQRLVTDTHSYIRRNQHKFEQAALMLVRKRSLAVRCADYVRHQSQLMGVLHTH